MKINDAVRLDIQNSVLCWLATVDGRGDPNVTPKEIFASHGDDRIVIADIASSGSVRNVHIRPQVCVSFVDVFRQRGYKITGRAEIVPPENSSFTELSVELLRMAGVEFSIRNIISVEVQQIARIRAPSFRLFPERSESERMRSVYDAYGVQPKS